MQSQAHRRRFKLIGSGLLLLAALATGADPKPASAPTYTKDKELVLPSGYHTWVFVGADLSLKYDPNIDEPGQRKRDRERTRTEDPESGDFHHIYIDRAAYEQFVKTKTFPDPTVLVMEVFRAKRKDPDGILSGGQFEGDRIGLEAAVKDTRRPGGGVPWAYYIFQHDSDPSPKSSAAALPDSACYDCHKKHASTDNVWVQFYPMLRDSKLRDAQ
jgi:hypothetical protein